MKPSTQLLLLGVPAYWRTVRALFGSSLIGYWPLTETSGTTAWDASGNGFNGTYHGPTLAQYPAPGGRAPYFDGVNDYINVTNAGFFSAFNADEGSLLILFQRKSTKAGYNTVLRLTSPSYTTDFWVYMVDTGWNIRRNAGGVNQTRTISGAAPLGSWVHAAATWSVSASQMRVFINGVEGTPLSGLGASAEACNVMTLGMSVSTYFFEGYLAHFILLNRAAAPEEIRKVYRLGV